jgi:putative sigma-54 modulation protein
VQVSISARHGQLSEATREKIASKTEKLTRLFERLTAIEVEVDLGNKESLMVEIQVSAEHKHDFVAREQGDELMSVLDATIHKIEQQIRKYKEKVQDHHR